MTTRAAFLTDLERATLAVYERYAIEVVERFGFCPWARESRRSGHVALRVVFTTDPHDFASTLSLLAELHHAPSPTDIALFIYPLSELDRLGFEDYVRRLRTLAEAPAHGLDGYAMAAFHPGASADLSHPDKLVPYVRKSPDPTLQLVRKSALSAIKGLSSGTSFIDVSTLSLEGLGALSAPPRKPVRERIAEDNLATVGNVGLAAVDAVLDDIAREREALHERLRAVHGQRGPLRLPARPG